MKWSTAIIFLICLGLGYYWLRPGSKSENRLASRQNEVSPPVEEVVANCKRFPETCVSGVGIVLKDMNGKHKPGSPAYKKAINRVLRMTRVSCESGDDISCYNLAQALLILGKRSKANRWLAKACPQLKGHKIIRYELCNKRLSTKGPRKRKK